MKIIKKSTKMDNCNIVEVSDDELRLFEMQKARKVKNAVRKSITNLIMINEDIITALKSAIIYNNLAYKSKIECDITTAEFAPCIKKQKTIIKKVK